MRNRRQHYDFSEIMAGLDRLAEAKEPIAREIGVAMGQTVRDEAKLRVPVGTQYGGSKSPGLLRSALYLAYDDRRNVLNPDRYRYVVSWNSKKAPHGHLIEFGHWMPYTYRTDKQGHYWTPKPLQKQEAKIWVAAHPFLGPAFSATQPSLFAIGMAAGKQKFLEAVRK